MNEEALFVTLAVAGVVMVGAAGGTVLRSQLIVAAVEATPKAFVCVREKL